MNKILIKMEKKEIKDKIKEIKIHLSLAALDRHFIWADYFKRLHYSHLKENTNIIKDIGIIKFYISPVGINMCYWYASLYTVLEGLDDMKIEFDEISDDITDIKEPLRLFRNVIFHNQKDYWDDRLLKIINTKNSRLKIRRVHEFLDQKLKEMMKKDIPIK